MCSSSRVEMVFKAIKLGEKTKELVQTQRRTKHWAHFEARDYVVFIAAFLPGPNTEPGPDYMLRKCCRSQCEPDSDTSLAWLYSPAPPPSRLQMCHILSLSEAIDKSKIEIVPCSSSHHSSLAQSLPRTRGSWISLCSIPSPSVLQWEASPAFRSKRKELREPSKALGLSRSMLEPCDI